MAAKPKGDKIDEVGNELSELALTIASEASGDNVPFDQRLDAFKALTQYYGVVRKVDPKGSDNSGVFHEYRKRVQSTEAGST